MPQHMRFFRFFFRHELTESFNQHRDFHFASDMSLSENRVYSQL